MYSLNNANGGFGDGKMPGYTQSPQFFENGRLSPKLDFSYDSQSMQDGFSNRITSTAKISESWNAGNISRITGARGNGAGIDISTSNFIDDSKMMDMLYQNDNIFEEIDMG